nr:hypothetical protein [Tanacetum cinerariifolium]
MVLERLSQPIAQPTEDPLALLSNVSNTQNGSPSLSTSSIGVVVGIRAQVSTEPGCCDTSPGLHRQHGSPSSSTSSLSTSSITPLLPPRANLLM